MAVARRGARDGQRIASGRFGSCGKRQSQLDILRGRCHVWETRCRNRPAGVKAQSRLDGDHARSAPGRDLTRREARYLDLLWRLTWQTKRT